MATVATMVAEMANGPLPRLGWCCECVMAWPVGSSPAYGLHMVGSAWCRLATSAGLKTARSWFSHGDNDWNPILFLPLSPKLARVGKNFSNMNCKAMWILQLCLHKFGLSHHGLQTIGLPTWVHENCNSVQHLAKFWDSKTALLANLWALNDHVMHWISYTP
jgi:hypothetical protein